ncbi:MAG TPA: DinB family protein, partial [Acidobacteriaceae bacterium]
MHPVLKTSLDPLARLLENLTVEEAQAVPLPGPGRWSAQQVIEHLILTYKMTEETVNRHLKSGRAAKKGRGPILSLLRMQVIGFGRMPRGVPSVHAARPKEVTPMDGQALAERFWAAAEEMDALLSEARKKFGIQACGEHWFYGGLRVDEWRRYHAVHGRH